MPGPLVPKLCLRFSGYAGNRVMADDHVRKLGSIRRLSPVSTKDQTTYQTGTEQRTLHTSQFLQETSIQQLLTLLLLLERHINIKDRNMNID
jgi:hypothetical protein